MKMGRLGVWAQVDCMTASAEAEFARDVEQWGYSALWTPEAMGRDVLVIAQTAAARAVLGPNKLLCVEQKVLLETNAASAREVARAYLRPYLRLSNYVNSWRRAGFDDGDFADNGSNRLVGTLVAWGDEDALVGRIRERWQAGADHICIQALHADQSKSTFDGPNIDLIQRLRRSHVRATRRGECRMLPRTAVPVPRGCTRVTAGATTDV